MVCFFLYEANRQSDTYFFVVLRYTVHRMSEREERRYRLQELCVARENYCKKIEFKNQLVFEIHEGPRAIGSAGLLTSASGAGGCVVIGVSELC